MLNITCKHEEGVVIGPDIRVMIDMSSGRSGRTMLKIQAPKSVRIARIDREGNLTRSVGRIQTALAVRDIVDKAV